MQRLFFLWGVLIPMPAIALDMGNSLLALSNVILLLIIIKKFLYSNRICIYVNVNNCRWYAFVLSVLITSMVSFYTFSSEWLINSISLSVKNLFFILAILLLFKNNELLNNRIYFIKGLYYSALINLLWAYLQLYFGYVLGININEVVFSNVLHLNGGVDWNQNVANGIVYRMSGLSWEPANFGLIANIGIILSSNIYLKIAFAIGILLSTSKMGMMCLAVILIVDTIRYIQNSNKNRIYIKSNKLMKSLFIGIIIIAICLYFENIIISGIERICDMFDVLNIALTSMDNTSANIHKLYYEKLLYIYSNSDLLNILFGYGMFCAGYPYVINNIVMYSGVWNPESDFITLFIGNGIVGGFIYYAILMRGLFYNHSYKIRMIILTIIVAGVFYLQVKGWIIPLILITALPEKMEKAGI